MVDVIWLCKVANNVFEVSKEENEWTTFDNFFYGNPLSEITSHQHISKFIIDSDVLMPEIELEQTF